MTVDVDRIVRDVLHGIAPEVDIDEVPVDANLQDELDLDSMDFLNYATGVSKQCGIAIPESDYERISTLAGVTGYLRERLPDAS